METNMDNLNTKMDNFNAKFDFMMIGVFVMLGI